MLAKGDIEVIGGDYRRENLGQGIDRLAKATDEALVTGRNGLWLGNSGYGVVIDQALAELPDRQIKSVMEPLADVLKQQDMPQLHALMSKILKDS